MTLELPARGFIFWPVGCGDSTTIKVNENVVVQIDLHHMDKSDDDSEPTAAVVDRLMEILPRNIDGVPYLAVFGLTHQDLDHIQGFIRLMEFVKAGKLVIGELWFTPRIMRENTGDEPLSDEAQAFCDEAMRRVAVVCAAGEDGVGAGDRVLVIGSDDVLAEDDFKDLPARFKRRPGDEMTILDGVDLAGTFRVFFHAPFHDDSTGERNRTSLGMQITLTDGEGDGKVMLLGDLDYPPLKRIFTKSDPADVAWDVFLAPHHCSKSAMYFKTEDDDAEALHTDVVTAIGNAAGTVGYVVASSTQVPATDTDGANPPHAKAKAQYESVAPTDFLCTADFGTDDPIVFEVTTTGIALMSGTAIQESKASDAVEKGRGGGAPATNRVGFGRC